jgi:trk system potassium uptake protein TrkH
MVTRARALEYAVRVPVVAKYLGQLCIVVAALSLAPLAVSLVFSEFEQSLRYLPVIAVLAAFGLATRRINPPEQIQINEVLVIIALIFILIPLLMTIVITSAGIGFIDAYFEAVSGVTTTGLSCLATVEDKPHTFLFARAWMQWYGGLGIVAFSLALFIQPGRSAKELAVAEIEEEDLIGGTRAHAQRIIRIYAALTAIGVVLLLVTGAGFFDSLLYSFAGVSTGGYAPYDDSLAGLGFRPRQVAVTLSFISGAVPLTIYSGLFRRRGGYKTENLEMIWLLILCLFFSAATFALMTSSGYAPLKALLDAPVLAFSAQTTAGFSGVDVPALGNGVKALMLFPMLIGGGIGSTAGGFKIIRLLVALKVVHSVVKRTGLARRAVYRPHLMGRSIDESLISDVLRIIFLYLAVTALSWLAFVIYGYAPFDSLFDVVSAVGTVGLSAGVAGPDLPAVLKGVLIADMIMGRLEIVALLVLFSPATWIGRRHALK